MIEFNGHRQMSVIFESRSLTACKERALVLQAVGIPHEIIQLDQWLALAVAAVDAGRAREEIRLYEHENHGWPPQLAQMPTVSNGVIGVMIYLALLIVIHLMSHAGAFDRDWLAVGRVDGRLMLSGEWWRSVTALTLHADVAHLAGNLVFGAIFGLFVAQLLGQGLGWSLILAGGALGNITNVLIQHPSHRAVGASTAVFAALGVLTAYTWMHRRDSRYQLAFRSAPLVSGLVLLAYLGTGDARTDIVAHLTGFAWGMAGGIASAYWPAITGFAESRQLKLGIGALGAVVLAWLVRLPAHG